MSTRYSRVPEEVLTDPELSPTDVRLYAVMAMHAYENNIIIIGQRRMATLTHIDRRSVRRSLVNLSRRGHISVAMKPLKKRSVFQLNSTVFGTPKIPQLGGEMRPDLGGDVRPRIDIYKTPVSSFPKPKKA